MKRVPTDVVKARSREISIEVDSWTDAYIHLVGSIHRCCIVDTAADGVSLVGHNKTYAQVLLPAEAPDGSGNLMGCVVEAKIVSASRWSVKGQVLKVLYRPSQIEKEGNESKDTPGGIEIEGVVPLKQKQQQPHKEQASFQSTATAVENPLFVEEEEEHLESSSEVKSTSTISPAVPAPVLPTSRPAASVQSSPAKAAAAEIAQQMGIVSHESPAEELLQKLVWFGIVAGLAAVLLSGILTLLQ
jgi:hypothetical protein